MALSNMYGSARTLIDSDYRRIGSHLVSPFDTSRVQPASYDVALGDRLLVPTIKRGISYLPEHSRIDLRTRDPGELVEELTLEKEGYALGPDACVLAATKEFVTCPCDMTCVVDGKSTLGRLFVTVHSTAGFVDPGFVGVITLEITNHGPYQVVLYPGMLIGQLRFNWLAVAAERPYGSVGLGSHYQGSSSVKAAAGSRGGAAR